MFAFAFRRMIVAAVTLFALGNAAIVPALAAAPDVLLAQAGTGCLSRRDSISAVGAGKAKPLSEIRDIAERAASGELINAELCDQSGRLTYVLTILPESGKMAYVTLDAVTGRVLNVR